MKDTLDFSFSGIKTALLHMAQDRGIYPYPDRGLDPRMKDRHKGRQGNPVGVRNKKL